MSSEPDVLLTVREAAKLLTVHEVTLNVWRLKDRGPPYRRLPGSDRIVYSRKELLEWSTQGRVTPEGVRELAHEGIGHVE